MPDYKKDAIVYLEEELALKDREPIPPRTKFIIKDVFIKEKIYRIKIEDKNLIREHGSSYFDITIEKFDSYIDIPPHDEIYVQ